MKNLLILTSYFPYVGGEQFFESEIDFWKKSQFHKIYLLPTKKNSKQRFFPSEFILLKENILTTSIVDKLLYLVLVFFTNFFWKEVFYLLFKRKSIAIINYYDALIHSGNVLRCKRAIGSSLNQIDGGVVVYSYWNDVQFYAACLLKREGKINKLISRAHGGDLYEERRRGKYMPLKRQFKNYVDKVYLLSESSKEYYSKTYDFSNKKLDVARLGVNIPLKTIKVKKKYNKIKILSLSYCVQVKRIDKIIDALACFSLKNSDFYIEWEHIGGGPLFHCLNNLAFKKLKNIKNIKFEFKGELMNKEVLDLMSNNYFDIFINASESEGIPVSIMEAMSHGIPAIAPKIGGIPDLINKSNGWLVSEIATIDEITNSLEQIKECIKNDRMGMYRENSVEWIKKYFNAQNNYSKFVDEISELAEL